MLLGGLDDRLYDVSRLAPGDEPRTLQRVPPPWWAGTTMGGRLLGRVGLAGPVLCPDQLLLLSVCASA